MHKYSEHLLGVKQCTCSHAGHGPRYHDIYILTGVTDILNKYMLNKLLNRDYSNF